MKDSALSPLLYTYVALNYHLEITTFFVGTNVMDKTYEWTKSVQLFRLDDACMWLTRDYIVACKLHVNKMGLTGGRDNVIYRKGKEQEPLYLSKKIKSENWKANSTLTLKTQ